MAETMTYDPGTDTVTTEDTLTAEEQESLVVGEEMEAQQEQLLAGKYKNAEDLEKAYIELQSKLGSEETKTEEEDVETEASTDQEPEPNDWGETGKVVQAASDEYYETGKLSEATMAEFAKMSTQDLVNTYVAMTNANPQQQQEVADLSEGDINSIKNSVGGDSEYSNLVQWASENLDQGSVQAFDSLIDSGNAGAIQLAVNGLKAQYESANGYEGRMFSGKPPVSSGEVFRSQPELVAAMSDPRYDNDPAYRQDIIEKLDRSDLAF